MPTDRINFLIALYFNNTITEAQQAELSQLIKQHTSDGELGKLLEQAWHEYQDDINMPEISSQKIISSILNQASSQDTEVILNKENFTDNKVWWLKRIAVAASLLIIFSISYFMIKPGVSSNVIVSNIKKPQQGLGIQPGGQKATLTLADGSKLILDTTNNGLVTKQGGANIIKLDNGQLQYVSGQIASSETVYNTMSTPVGGQYELVLPDGTKVWLNSSSSIKYPTTFFEKERRVEITGEAYFEVAKNAHQPFKVKINLQNGEGGEVEVLGTHFNINAYDDETAVRTTLFEGSVKVNRTTGTTQIKPGQQLQSDKAGQVKIINDADLEEVIAWKEGRFQFESADIKNVMRQLARWYDIDVEYKENIARHFGGTISRNVNILKVLEMLELTGEIKFKVEDRKVIVMNGKN